MRGPRTRVERNSLGERATCRGLAAGCTAGAASACIPPPPPFVSGALVGRSAASVPVHWCIYYYRARHGHCRIDH
eukprot:1190711-Prorocentrum_minimum.AAC.1